MDEVRQGATKHHTGIVEYLLGNSIALFGGIKHVLRGDVVRIQFTEQGFLLGRGDDLLGCACHAGSRSIGLQVSLMAATAHTGVLAIVHGHVS